MLDAPRMRRGGRARPLGRLGDYQRGEAVMAGRGEKNHSAKLTEAAVRDIRTGLPQIPYGQKGKYYRDMAEK